MQEKINFYSLNQDDLKQFLVKLGKENYRSQQIFKWAYDRRITDFKLMTNISKDVQAELSQVLDFSLPKIISHLKSVDGTQKFLFDVGGGNTIEAVLIPNDDRQTLCVSSEIGCNMACKFCFTGKQKLKRRLRTEEIVGQFMAAQDAIQPQGLRITNVVFMGMGEPLDNPEAVFKSVEILNDQWGRNFSRRKVTISTSGLVPEMWRIAASKTRLAVSLNGSNDEVRSHVMPINKKYPIADLMKACRDYIKESGERVTFEYVMLKGVTDSLEHAKELYHLTKNINSKINLIPFNEHPGSGFERPDDATILSFQKELMRLGAHAIIRKTMGRDIFAACGQLTSEYENKPQEMDISNSKIGSIHWQKNKTKVEHKADINQMVAGFKTETSASNVTPN